jgi:putative transposase
MPDHLHVLVEGTAERSDLRAFVKIAKQLSGFYCRRQIGEALWQRYGFEHVLRRDEDVLGIARYILENPLRQGLACSVFDYPFVGSDSHTLGAIADAVQMENNWKPRSS